MWRIIQKDMKYYLVAFLSTYPLMMLFWTAKRDSSAFILVFFIQVMLLGALVVLPPLFAEQEEDVNDGYVVLQILPLTKKSIMAGKFMAPLLNALLLYLSNRYIFSLFDQTPEVIRLVDAVQSLTIAICLCIIGIIYLVVMKIGYTDFLKYASFITVALAFSSVFVTYLFRIDVERFSRGLMEFIGSIDPVKAGLGGLLLYLLLYFLSLKLDRNY